MKAKIDWYKEVLELEPGSKVFFPLARLLAENGQVQEALSTLRIGLERHPEFIEARLYLIELLYKNRMIAQCEPQVGQLTRLFSQYPGFWEAWGVCIAGTEKRRDLPLALRFLALLFQRPDIGFDEVLEKGLFSLTVTSEEAASDPEPEIKTNRKSLPTIAVAPSGMPADMPERTAATETKAVNRASPMPKRMEDVEDTEEPFTLRTKSMADVLAGQSDINGALEIYHELALRAESPEKRQAINERIAQLSSLQVQAVDAPSSPQPQLPPPGKQRMQHLLESLAERLEARALG